MDLFSKESSKIGGQIQLHLPFRRIYKFELINAVFLLSFLWPKRLVSNLPLSFRRALKNCLLFMLQGHPTTVFSQMLQNAVLGYLECF